MFKKTLLAASILGASTFAANAAQITVTVDEEPTAKETAIDAAATATLKDACTTAAATLGVSVVQPATGGPFAITAGADQTVNVVAGTADFQFTDPSVTASGAETCDVVVGDQVIGASTAKYSAEGAAANGVVLDVDVITGIGGVAAEQTIIFTVEGGTIDQTLSLGATLTTGDPVSTASVFTLTGVVGNTILFSANGDYPTTAVQRQILELKGVAVIPNTGVTEVTLSAETTNTSGIVVDNADAEGVTNIAPQYSASVPVVLDGVIDVTDERKSLAVIAKDSYNSSEPGKDTAEAANEDTLVVKVDVETSQGNLVPTEATITLKGKFGWLAELAATAGDLPTTGEISTSGAVAWTPYADYGSETGGTYTAPTSGDDTTPVYAVNATYDELTIKFTPGGTEAELDAYHEIRLAVPAGNTTGLDTQDYLATVTTSDGGTGSAIVVPADTAVGAWSLNGSVVTIPYMAFGPNTRPIIRHFSTSNQVGDITVQYILEDNDTDNGDDWQSVGVVKTDVANGMLNITKDVMDAILEDAGLDSDVDNGKVAIEITTNVPAAGVTVFAGYNVKNSADDRAVVGTFGELGAAGKSTLND
jgi:hypothetical protein